MAGFEAAAGGGSPGGAGSKHHRARQQSLGGGSRPEETVEAMCRPRAPLLRALQRLAAPFLTPVSASVQNVSFMVGTMPVDISEVLQATNGTAQEAALNKICSDNIPSPVQEELQPVVEPSVPTTPAFYKSIGRLNKGLLNKGFALTPISTSRMKVPFGPDSKSYVSMVVCTGNSKVAAKVSCASLFEDKLRMTFMAGLGDFKPKAKLFYSFPFAGVNGALNARVVCGDSPDLKLALTLEKQGLVAGGKVLLDPLTKKLKHHEVGVSYGPGALKLLDCDRLKLSLYDGGLSQVVAGGLELTYLRCKEEATVCAAVCAKLGDSTTVKAKVDTSGAVSAAVRHRLADDFEAGACVRVQLGKVSRFGFSISSRF